MGARVRIAVLLTVLNYISAGPLHEKAATNFDGMFLFILIRIIILLEFS